MITLVKQNCAVNKIRNAKRKNEIKYPAQMLEVAIDLCWVPAKLENPVEISHLALIFQIELVVTSFHLGYAGWQYVSL